MKRLLRSRSAQSAVLLAASAVGAKFLAIIRDRVLVQYFAESGELDWIFAAFRIPDFFFFLLIGGTVATLFVPRYHQLKKSAEKTQFLSSFWWLVFAGFGGFCLLGALFPQVFVPLFAGGFDAAAQAQVAELARILFFSVFLLSLSSVLGAFLQARETFWSIALSQFLYTGVVCAGVYFFVPSLGLEAVPMSALLAASVHLMVNGIAFWRTGIRFQISWQKPIKSWKKFSADFLLRLGTGASFQINQSVDVLIASFLLTGSVAAFSVGSAAGHALLSVVGFSVAKVLFPKLSHSVDDPIQQKKYLIQGVAVIAALTVPPSIFAWSFSAEILQWVFSLSGETLTMTDTVFRWTVLSLPFACLCPLFSRGFFAKQDTKTPTIFTTISLVIATSLAAVLSLGVFTGAEAILGLAVGNFVANTLSASLLGGFLWRKI